MDKQELVELTNKFYKITLLFPKKEPLRYKMRELADEILANFVSLETLKNSNPGNLAANWETRYKDSVFLMGKDLEILKCYLGIAKWQNWVSFFDILEIEKEYDKIQNKIEEEIKGFELITDEDKREISQAERAVLKPLIPSENIPSEPPLPAEVSERNLDGQATRQGKILNILKEKEKVQVWQMKEVFPEVTKRTLRRDFERLLKQGLVERIGEKNNTFYKLLRNSSQEA